MSLTWVGGSRQRSSQWGTPTGTPGSPDRRGPRRVGLTDAELDVADAYQGQPDARVDVADSPQGQRDAPFNVGRIRATRPATLSAVGHSPRQRLEASTGAGDVGEVAQTARRGAGHGCGGAAGALLGVGDSANRHLGAIFGVPSPKWVTLGLSGGVRSLAGGRTAVISEVSSVAMDVTAEEMGGFGDRRASAGRCFRESERSRSFAVRWFPRV